MCPSRRPPWRACRRWPAACGSAAAGPPPVHTHRRKCGQSVDLRMTGVVRTHRQNDVAQGEGASVLSQLTVPLLPRQHLQVFFSRTCRPPPTTPAPAAPHLPACPLLPSTYHQSSSTAPHLPPSTYHPCACRPPSASLPSATLHLPPPAAPHLLHRWPHPELRLQRMSVLLRGHQRGFEALHTRVPHAVCLVKLALQAGHLAAQPRRHLPLRR